MGKYVAFADLEELFDKIKLVLCQDLNGEIDKINEAKGDKLLNHFSESQINFFFRGIFPNFNEFIYIESETIDQKTNFDDSAEIPLITIWAGMTDDLKNSGFKKSIRIQNALKKTILGRSGELSASGIDITQSQPFLVEGDGKFKGTLFLASGIQFTCDYV